MLANVLQVLWQLMLASIGAAGFGYWLWRFIGRPNLSQRFGWLWFGCAGQATHALILQSLVYLNLPLRWTAWPALAVAIAGVIGIFRVLTSAERSERARASAWRGPVLVFAVVFAGQGAALFLLGPDRFYGNGRYDHANYVTTAEFLRTEAFATTPDEIQFRPWIVRPVVFKEQRITSCVALGALAEVSGTDAQQAYGTMSVFLVALAAAATAAWLAGRTLPSWAATAAATAAGLSPIWTRLHLEGFFSQVATLFVYPALAGVLAARGPMSRESKLIAAILLGYLLGAYTEIVVFGGTLVAALILANDEPVRTRCRNLLIVGAGALLINPGFVGRLGVFVVGQWTMAANPDMLATFFPHSGTWEGWGEMFVAISSPQATVAAGAAVALLAVVGCLAPTENRLNWLVTIGVALLPILALRVLPAFPSYAFAKLVAHFLPVWLGAAAAGAVWLAQRSARLVRPAMVGMWLAAAAIAVTAWPLQRAAAHPTAAPLAVLCSERIRELRRTVGIADGAHTYLVAQDNPLLAQWLCYYARSAPVVLDRRNVGDRLVPTESYAFRRWSGGGKLYWCDLDLDGPVTGYEAPPLLEVRDARESHGVGIARYYVAGAETAFALTRPAAAAPRAVSLEFVIIPLGPGRVPPLELVGPDGEVQRSDIASAGWRRWRLAVPGGTSVWRLRMQTGAAADSGTIMLKTFSVEPVVDSHQT